MYNLQERLPISPYRVVSRDKIMTGDDWDMIPLPFTNGRWLLRGNHCDTALFAQLDQAFPHICLARVPKWVSSHASQLLHHSSELTYAICPFVLPCPFHLQHVHTLSYTFPFFNPSGKDCLSSGSIHLRSRALSNGMSSRDHPSLGFHMQQLHVKLLSHHGSNNWGRRIHSQNGDNVKK